jgi:hypothetical protein
MTKNFEQILVPKILKEIDRPCNVVFTYPWSDEDQVSKITKKIDAACSEIAEHHRIELYTKKNETETLIDAIVKEMDSLQLNRRKKKLIRLLALVQLLGERKNELLKCLKKPKKPITDLMYGRFPSKIYNEDWREQL